MPILRAETFLHPAELLACAHGEVDVERRWWAVHTKPRQEKSLARQLLGHDIPFYLPVYKQRSVVGKRTTTSHVPLFPSYLFLCATEAERLTALTTQRAVHMLAPTDPAAFLRDLRSVQLLIDSGASLTPESRLEPGRRVRVKSGALLGTEGVIISRRGVHCLLVSVQFLQQGVSVQIDQALVEPLE